MPSANAPISANDIIGYVDTGDLFTLQSRGNRILIFSKGATRPNPKDIAALRKEISNLAKLGRFTVELKIPHAFALGDVGAKMKSFGYSDFSIDPAGPDSIRVSSPGAPDCVTWQAFLTGVRDLARNVHPVSPVEKAFYLNGADVSGALNSNSPSSAIGSQVSPPKATKYAAAPAKPAAPTPDDNQGSGDDAAIGGSADRMATGSGGVDQKPPAAGDTPRKTAAPSPPTDAKVRTRDAVATVTPLSSSPDLLIFSEPNQGDDDEVNEKRRIIAMLDLPRPEMLVNVWSSQISSDDPNQVATEIHELQTLVSGYNERLQAAIFRAWITLKARAATPSTFYNQQFYKYLSYQSVADTITEPSDPDFPLNADQSVANKFLDGSLHRAVLTADFRSKWGLCLAEQYCLGYTELFHPLKPRLTDLLLAVIAAEDPDGATTAALNAMESEAETPNFILGKACEDVDRQRHELGLEAGPRLVKGPLFECFRRVAKATFRATDGGVRPNALGVLRTAVADFLYNWKVANQYPHEFSAYDLDQSAGV